MSQEENRQTTMDNFIEIFKNFGDVISEIFDDPELKEKAKSFVDSAEGSVKAFGDRFKDEEVQEKFRDVGKAAEDFGKSIANCFKKTK